MNSVYHTPVLLHECINGLNIQPDGCYVDVTFGGGGHSKAIIRELSDGKLIGFDQDPDAVANAIDDVRFVLVKKNFRTLKIELNALGIEKVDGILADLGVSSHQFDTPERGFSIRFDAPLDMRMDKSRHLTAAIVLNTYSESQLKELFYRYGEIDQSYKLAREIASARKTAPIETANELRAIAIKFSRPNKENQFMAQLFQALRIEVNDELNALKDFLLNTAEVIKPGGRLVVMSYHSLEDRLVKNFIRDGKFQGDAERDFFGNRIVPFKAINKKPIEPSEEEITNNNRARSAKLRIAEKI